MVKKIVFFGLALVIGFMVLFVAYSGFQMSALQTQITEYMENDDYESLAKTFLSYYDAATITIHDTTDKYEIVSLQSVASESITITIDDEEETTNDYYLAYTFFLNHINDVDLNGVDFNNEGTVYNFTSVVFINSDTNESYTYYFNDPITATSSDDATRYYTSYVESMGFVEIDISLETIEEELSGQITGYEFYDSKEDLVGSGEFETALTTSSGFYDICQELIDAWDTYLDGLSSSNEEEKAETFNNFYTNDEGTGWLETYTSLSTTYGRGIQAYSDLIGNTAIIKTVIVMIIYIIICGLLGYFFLRTKNRTPKPYLRDQYKKQLLTAKDTSIKTDVTETSTSEEAVTLEEPTIIEEVSNEETPSEDSNVEEITDTKE